MQMIPNHIASIVQTVWPILCHSLWLLPLIVIVESIWPNGPNADRNYRRIQFALAACLMLPVCMGRMQVLMRYQWTQSFPQVQHNLISASLTHDGFRNVNTMPRSVMLQSEPGHAAIGNIGRMIQSLAKLAVYSWAVFVIFWVFRLSIVMLVLHIIIQRALRSDQLQCTADTIATRLGLRRVPQVMICKHSVQPALCGLLKTSIILPQTWVETAGPDEVEAVLAHELAHAKRHDPRNLLLERAVQIACFFHPVTRRLLNRAALAREMATDRLCVMTTKNPVALAVALESVALWAAERNRWSHFNISKLSFAALRPPGHLHDRVESLLHTEGVCLMRNDHRVRWFAVPLVFAMSITSAWLVQTSAIAQDEPRANQMEGNASVNVPRITMSGKVLAYEVRVVHIHDKRAIELLTTNQDVATDQNGRPAGIRLKTVNAIDEATRDSIANESASTMQFPKVTAFEGNTAEYHYVSANADAEGYEIPAPTAQQPNPKPRFGKFPTRLDFELTGQTTPDGIKISLKGTDRHLIRRPVSEPNAPFDPNTPVPEKSNAWVMVMGDRTFDSTMELKKDQSLLVNLGVVSEAMPQAFQKEARQLGLVRLRQYFRMAIVTPYEAVPEPE